MDGWEKSMGKPEGKTSLAGSSELPDDILELQQLAFRYFLNHTNARNGLVADNSSKDSPCSIAATGLGLSTEEPRQDVARQYGVRAVMIGVKPDGQRLASIGKTIADGKLRPVV